MNQAITKRSIFYIFPPFFYAVIITFLSSIPHEQEALFILFNVDKVLHLIEYFMFGYLLMRMFMTFPGKIWGRYSGVFTLLIGILFAAGDEWHQSFVPGRCSSVYDFLFDVSGVIIAAMAYRYVRYRVPVIRRIEERVGQI
jgi:VanZ family protein